MRSIFKQSSWLMMAQGLARVIGFFYTIYLARNLEIEEFGIIATALAYFSIFSVLADFGFNRYLIKEVSQDHLKAPKLLFNVTIIRLALTTILFGIFSFVLYIFDSDSMRRSVILLAMLAVLPQAIAFSMDSIFVAFRKLEFSSISLVILSLSTTILGIYLVNFGYGPIGVIVASILGQIIYVVSLIIFLRHLKVGIKIDEEVTGMKGILKEALPFGVLGILGLLYFKVDTLMLSYMRGNFETGIYTAAYRFLEAVIIIPSAFASALFPILTKLHTTDLDEVKKVYFKSLKLLFSLSLFIVVGYFLILPIFIKTFLPNYSDTTEILMILTLTIPFMFIHIPAAIVLMSTNMYIRSILVLSVLTLIFNILANLIFIPSYGYWAAAWITVVSEMLSFIVFFLFLKIKVFK
jgi:O-antigen/teichoic acid export membrane protein